MDVVGDDRVIDESTSVEACVSLPTSCATVRNFQLSTFKFQQRALGVPLDQNRKWLYFLVLITQ